MTRIARINRKIQRGRGKAASVYGQTYDVRRLNIATNGSVSSNPPIIRNFEASLTRAKKIAVENEIFSLLCFDAECDNTRLQLMDELTETGYEAMPQGVYIVAQMRPMRSTLLMRADMTCTVSRPTPTAGLASAMPEPGTWIEQTGQGSVDKSNEQILTLVDGLYAFANPPVDTPATVQCQLQPLNRIRDGKILGVPAELYREHFLIYVPELPGEQLDELDRFNFPNSGSTTDRYGAMSIYSSEQTGLSGYIIIAEKMGG